MTSHAAALYDSDEDLCARVLPYLREGLDRGEAAVAIVSTRAEDVLRSELGDDAKQVQWQAPGVNYTSLGRMFEAFRGFLAGQRAAGVPTRLLAENGINGDPGRTAAYLRFEAMSTEVHGTYGFPYACLYDRCRYPAEVLERVAQVHPLLLSTAGQLTESTAYVQPESYLTERAGPLSAVPQQLALDIQLTGISDLPAARRRVTDTARALGVPTEECRDVELATGEVLTNALQHGIAPYRVRMWSEDRSLAVRVDDCGRGGTIATAGFRPPRSAERSSAGLWVVQQCADVVHVGVGPEGTGVELRFPLGQHQNAGEIDMSTPAESEAIVSAFDQTPLMLAAYEGPDLVIVGVNEKSRQFVGHLEPLGKTAAEWLRDVNDSRMLELLRRPYLTGQPATVREWRMQFPGPDGQLHETYLNVECTPWRYPDGRIRGVLGTASDVTELVHARQAAEARSAELGQRYQRARDLVGALQQALLPSDLPALPGVRLAAHYLLADADTAAGGDWFDAIPLDDGRIALVVGDVVGHGVAAAAVMGQLRAVLRERLRSGAPLADALAALDRFATDCPGARATTVCLAVLDSDSGDLQYCTAGHPPPLVVSQDGGTRYLIASGTGPLATGSTITTATDRIESHELLLLYSDGIIERPGRTPAQSTVELAQVAGDIITGRVFPADTFIDAAERICRLGGEILTRTTGYTDDISLLATHRVAAPRVVQLRLPASVDSPRAARAQLGAWLRELHGGEDDLFALRHAVSELVSNSVEHAYRGGSPAVPPEIRVGAALAASGEVIVTVTDQGRWGESAPDQHRGHGLTMAADLVDNLEIERGGDGTTVTLRRRLQRPAVLLSKPRPPTLYGSSRSDEVFSLNQDGVGTLTVTGPLDLGTTQALRAELLRATRGGTKIVTVDLSGVSHLASSGVQVLHEAVERSSAQHQHLRLIAPPGSVAQHILVLVGLSHFLTEPAADGGCDTPRT